MFCNLLIELKRRKLTQKEVARRTGLSEKSLYLKLNGDNEFTLAQMEKIREIMPDCTLDYLFKRDE